jgi:signal transduction histidine kinase
VAALTRHASGLSASDGLVIDVRGPESPLELPELTEAELFTIAREALTNVQKHARATAAHVRVHRLPREVLVEVRDNGRGFDAAAGHPGHFGLESMRTRAADIDGRLTIRSSSGLGTLVRVRVPTTTGPI